MQKHARYFLPLLLLSLTGCQTMDDILPSWMGGNKEDKPKLAGERITVLPTGENLTPDASISAAQMTLPLAIENPDWPQHTGSTTSSSSNLSLRGSLDSETKQEAGDGEGFAHTLVPRPVVAGGMVFAMDAEGNISAHEAGNIKHVMWKSKGVAEEDVSDTVGGGLTFDNGKLYAVSGRGLVVALDAANGKEIWRKDLHIPFRASPHAAGDKLFVITIDNQVFALNAATGDIAWDARGIDETAGLMNSVSPAVDGDTVIVPYSSGELYALSATDGKEIWNNSLIGAAQTQAGGQFAGIGGDPVVDGDVVFAVSSSGSLSVFAVTSGQPLWSQPVSSINTPWVSGDYVFLLTSDNTLVAFVKYNGAIRWATKIPSYEDEASHKNPITWKGPVLVGSQLIVAGSRGKLMLISAADGTVTDTKDIPDDIYTAPVVAGGYMYLEDKDANLYSFK